MHSSVFLPHRASPVPEGLHTPGKQLTSCLVAKPYSAFLLLNGTIITYSAVMVLVVIKAIHVLCVTFLQVFSWQPTNEGSDQYRNSRQWSRQGEPVRLYKINYQIRVLFQTCVVYMHICVPCCVGWRLQLQFLSTQDTHPWKRTLNCTINRRCAHVILLNGVVKGELATKSCKRTHATQHCIVDSDKLEKDYTRAQTKHVHQARLLHTCSQPFTYYHPTLGHYNHTATNYAGRGCNKHGLWASMMGRYFFILTLLSFLTVGNAAFASNSVVTARCKGLTNVQIPHPLECNVYVYCCEGIAYPFTCKNCDTANRPFCDYGPWDRAIYNFTAGECSAFDR